MEGNFYMEEIMWKIKPYLKEQGNILNPHYYNSVWNEIERAIGKYFELKAEFKPLPPKCKTISE